MPATCGLACEVCGFPEKKLCPIGRCVPGTDTKAPEKLERFTAAMGHPCKILECAIENKMDYCTRCDSFPCDIHYQQGLFSTKLLDMLKGMIEKSKGSQQVSSFAGLSITALALHMLVTLVDKGIKPNALPGILGTIQAVETLKLIMGIGDTLAGKLLTIDALTMDVNSTPFERNPDCPVCGGK